MRFGSSPSLGGQRVRGRPPQPSTRAREVAFFAPASDAEDIDGARLRRAIWLDIKRVGPRRYQVSGGRHLHAVNLETEQQCDCRDYLWRACQCKHVLAARLREGDATVILALRLIVPRHVPA